MKLKLALSAIPLSAALTLAAGSALAQQGDPARGQQLYQVCAACHGANAEGSRDFNAPALAGLQDWYIVRSLQDFKSGIRGSNPQDVYGRQMAPMAQVLPDEQAMADVAAYITSLND